MISSPRNLGARRISSDKEKEDRNLIAAWRAFFLFILQYKQQVALVMALGAISALANGGVPFVVGKFFDALITPAVTEVGGITIPIWAILLFIWAGIQVFANSSDWFLSVQASWIGSNSYADYIVRMGSHLILLPISFHRENKIGDIHQRVVQAAIGVSRISEHVIISLLPQFVSIIVGMIFVFSIHPIAALIIGTGVIMYVLFLSRTAPQAISSRQKSNKAYNDAFGSLADILTSVQAAKQFAAEEYLTKRVRKDFVERAARFEHVTDRIWSSITFAQALVTLGTMSAIFMLAVALIMRGEMTIGELVALNGYAAMTFGPFAALGRNWQTIQDGIVAIGEAEKIIQMPTEQYEKKEGTEEPGTLSGAIVFDGVSFSYPGRGGVVLQDISFEIKAGETVALVGESGVGKTTLTDLLGAYYRPDEGEIFFDGYALSELPLRFVRSHMATVPQEPILFNESIRENLQFANRDATIDQIEQAARAAHAHDFITGFSESYETKVGEWGLKLSIGQKQRIAIARAILRNPTILILDEPTSALDAKTERIITESLEKLMAGRTTIIIAHRLSTVRKADKIIVLERGASLKLARTRNC